MLKPAALRAALVAANDWLQRDPDKLKLYIERGRIVATATASPSFEWRYQLQVAVLDYVGNPDRLVLPLLFWLRANEPALFANPDTRDQALTYVAEILDDKTQDLIFTFELSEVVAVTRRDDGRWEPTHLPEPPHGEWAYEPPLVDGVPPHLRALLLGDEPLIGDGA